MTFQVKKWTWFCLTLIVGILLYWEAYQFGKSRKSFFRLEYKQNYPHFYHLDGDVFQKFFPFALIFRTSAEHALFTEKMLEQKLTHFFYNLGHITALIDELNQKKSGISIKISKEEFAILSDILESLKISEIPESDSCSSQEISLLECAQEFPKLLSVKEEESQNFTPNKNYFLVKNKNQGIRKEGADFFFELYFVKMLENFLKHLSLDRFVFQTPRFILSQERMSRDGWAIQWDVSPKRLYYTSNELIYTSPRNATPDTFVRKEIKFDILDFPFIEFLNLYRKDLER